MQCKERVDLLEALRQSRTEAKGNSDKQSNGLPPRGRPSSSRTPMENGDQERSGWIGEGTVPTVNYPDLSRPGPPLPQRPAISLQRSSESVRQLSSNGPALSGAPPPYSPPTLPIPLKTSSRTPSPEKRSRMLTTLRPGKDGKRPSKSSRVSTGKRADPPAASKAAGLAWDSVSSRSSAARLGQSLAHQGGSSSTVNSINRKGLGDNIASTRNSLSAADESGLSLQQSTSNRSQVPPDILGPGDMEVAETKEKDAPASADSISQTFEDLISLEPPTQTVQRSKTKETSKPQIIHKAPIRLPRPADYISYRNEYPSSSGPPKALTNVRSGRSGESSNVSTTCRQQSPQTKSQTPTSKAPSRRPVANTSSPRLDRQSKSCDNGLGSSDSADENTSSSHEEDRSTQGKSRKNRADAKLAKLSSTPSSTDRDSPEGDPLSKDWNERLAYVKKHLPKGVDESAAKQIFNEIVVHGDEVHWSDVAGLDVAKKALKEAVVYPFLRPDLFMGLREPARGMLLFGPPGTGKTMLARAVATESRSTFFAISASSLTSKWLGESEKLVRALFALAKALAPSIIFVDEIDSLLSSRGGSSEHESTRRIKTEFLIQWSDLQRAAAGKEQTDREKKEGDASRVLVLAATNLPWAIDEAARRRFVRRQYIPLPEGHVRGEQLKTLLGHQKHELNKQDLQVLVELTDGEYKTQLYGLFELD